jgi:hypothetical protein
MSIRLALAVVLLVLGLVALYLLARDEGPSPQQAAVSSPPDTPSVEVEPALASAPPSELAAPPAESAPTAPGLVQFQEVDLPGRIFGRVYDGSGEPAAAAVVTACSVPAEGGVEDPRGPLEAIADGHGHFSIENVALGKHLVLARLGDETARAQCMLLAHAPVAEVALVLKPAQEIAGAVESNRAPVPGAALHPVLHNGKAITRDNALGWAVRTGDDGAFLFHAPQPGEWSFLVAAAGHALTVSPPVATGTRNARIQLTKGVAVSGRVLHDRTNAPAAGAQVVLNMEKLSGPPLIVQTNTSGAFTFPGVSAGSYLVDVKAEGYALPESPVRLAVANAPVNNLLLRLVSGGVIRGDVFVEETGQPLVGVDVHARRAGTDPLRRTSPPTSVNGQFEFAGLPPGEYVLNVRWAPGFAMVGRSSSGLTVHVQAGQIVEGVALALTQGLTVAGRVVDTQGNPIAGADVRGRGAGWTDQQISGADGRFILSNLAPETEITLSASTSGATSGPQGPLVVPGAGLRDIELVLSQPRDAVIAGVVVDVNNRPLPANVNAWPDGEEPVAYPPTDTTDAQGRFVLPNVAAGNYVLSVRPGQGEQLDVLRLSIAAGQQVRNLRLVYPMHANYAVGGRVAGRDGTGVACTLTLIRVEGTDSIFQAMATSTIEGAFRFENLTAGAYSIQAHESPGFHGATILNVQAGDEDVEILLDPA